MTNERPVLELLITPSPAPTVVALVHQLTRWCHPRAADPALPRPAARLATAPSAHGLARAVSDPETPLAVWVDDHETAERCDDGRSILLGPQAVADRVPSVLPVPHPGVDCSRWVYSAPFIRSRLRRRFRLPDDMVVRLGTPDAVELDDDLAGVAVNVASVVVAGGHWALTAMAAGAPVVTDAVTATALGAEPDVHLVIDATSGVDAVAARLSSDPRLAARLSLVARQFVEGRFDVVGAARRVATALGVTTAGLPPVARLRDRLQELDAPEGAWPSQRASDALRGLGPRTAAAVEAWPW